MNNEKLQFQEIFENTEKIETQVTSVDESLDIPKIRFEVEIKMDKVESKGDKEDFVSDVQFIRGKLLHSIAKADAILDDLIKMMAIDDQLENLNQPPRGFHRYYEVSSQLLKSICDASKELISLHSQNTKIKREAEWDKNKETIADTEVVNTKVSLRELINKVKTEKRGMEHDITQNPIE